VGDRKSARAALAKIPAVLGSKAESFGGLLGWLLYSRGLLIAAQCLAAAGARAEPQLDDAVLDPWAPVAAAPPAAAWSPPPVALIVNPWGEPMAGRTRIGRMSAAPTGQIVDPWSPVETPRAPGYRTAADLKLVEIVDPWAGRPGVARAAFPIEGLVDPWQSPSGNKRQ
jgi:hypothetical protein